MKSQITIPATHDSGAYELFFDVTDDSKCGMEVLKTGTTIADIIAILGLATPIAPLSLAALLVVLPILRTYIYGLARAQHMTIKKQLDNGIRYLDLRVCWDYFEFKTAHTLVGHKISDILDDIESFLNETENELVLVEIGVGSTTTDHRDELKKMIKDKFSNKMVPNDGTISLETDTLSTITNGGSKVLFIINEGTDPDFWPNPYHSASGDQTWGHPDAHKYSQRSSAEKSYLETSGDTLKSLGWTLTTSANYLAESVFDASLLSLSRIINPQLRDFVASLADDVQGQIRKISTDFFNESDVVPLAIELSMKDSK